MLIFSFYLIRFLMITSEYTHCVYSPYITIDCPFYIHFKKLRYIVEKMVK